MSMRRVGVAAVGLIAVAALATGCQKAAEQPGAGTSAAASAGASAPAQNQASASDALAAATDKLRTTTAKMTMTMAGTASMDASGSVDGPGKKTAMQMKIGAAGQSLTMDTIQIGEEVWLKAAGIPGMPADWMHITISQLGPDSSLRKQLDDPSFSANLLRSAAKVEWDGPGKIKGTIDMTKSPTMNATAAAALGEKGKAVPFTATIDDKGFLTSMTVSLASTLPAAGIGDMKTTYSNFGEPVTIAKPTGKIVEAPAALLSAL